MTDLLAIFWLLFGAPANQPTGPGEVTTQGGGIPVQPPVVVQE